MLSIFELKPAASEKARIKGGSLAQNKNTAACDCKVGRGEAQETPVSAARVASIILSVVLVVCLHDP